MRKIVILLLSLVLPYLTQSQVIINEYSAANYTDWNTGGEFEDWIELYNPTGGAIDISGFFLSDNINNPTKWEIPAGTTIAANNYQVFLCSGLAGINDNFGGYPNTNFKITQTSAEEIVFSDDTGTIIESYDFLGGANQTNHSMGRNGDGGADWVIYTNPTPNASNAGATANSYAPKPAFSSESGYYAAAQNITLTAGPGDLIYYTTNGDLPSNTSTAYAGPIAVNNSTVIRAITYSGDPNTLASFVETNTYFIGADSHTIPVISITGNTLSDGNWFGDEQTVIEYFDENGDFVSEAHGESNEHGNDSNAYGQRGFDYITRDQQGYDSGLEGQLFPEESDRSHFQRLIFKAAANDNYSFENGGAHVRDLYCHILSEKADLALDERRGTYCILYINAEYWGVYDMREKADDLDYTRYYYDQPRGFVDYLKTWGGTWADYGSGDDWDDLVDFITTNDMTDAGNYDYVKTQLNTNSLIDYFVMNSYVVTADWLNWNTAWWRGRHPDGDHKKWGYVLWDMDASFGHYTNYTGIEDQGPTADPCDPEVLGDPGGQGHVPILNALFTNEEFEADYINRYASLSNSYFSCDYMIYLLDSLTDVINPEMDRQINRWGGGSMAGWEANIQEVRDFILFRCSDEIVGGIEDCYDVESFTITVEIVGDGTVMASTVEITPDGSPWSGIFFSDLQIPFEAIDGNDSFFGWQVTSGNVTIDDLTNPDISFEITEDITLVALFEEPEPQDITFLVEPFDGGTITVNANLLATYPSTINLPFGANDIEATENTWFAFDHWETLNNSFNPDDVSAITSLSVTEMDTVIAVFTPIDHYVVTIDPDYITDGSEATVISDGAVVNPNTWETDVETGTVITLTTNSDNEWAVFDSWQVTGDIVINGDATDQNGSFTINGEGTIIPVYTILPHFNIQVSVQPEGSGTVSMDGILLNLPYTQVMAGEENIPFVANSDDEWTVFSHWEVQSATLNPFATDTSITAYFTQDDHLIAVFDIIPHYDITVIVQPSNGGTVRVSDEVSVTSRWTGVLAGDEPIDFSAYENEFHTFEDWRSTSSNPALPNDEEKNVTFTFYSTDTIIAHFPQDDETMFIPNSFTPNNDGINERFIPLGYAYDLTSYQLNIYDRWGMRVFETQDFTKGWDGSHFRGGYYVPDGTYIYSLSIKRINDPEVVHFNGNVTILR